jgi:hypothetical protein
MKFFRTNPTIRTSSFEFAFGLWTAPSMLISGHYASAHPIKNIQDFSIYTIILEVVRHFTLCILKHMEHSILHQWIRSPESILYIGVGTSLCTLHFVF